MRLRKGRCRVPDGTLGCIMAVLGNGEAYIVEFINDEGETYEDGLMTDFSEEELEKCIQ